MCEEYCKMASINPALSNAGESDGTFGVQTDAGVMENSAAETAKDLEHS